jgi:excisionase family DNA binding protein
MGEQIDQDRAVEKIVDAFRLTGELLGYAVAYRLAAESQGALVQMPASRGPLLMSLKQAADYLGMGRSSLSLLISQGKIPRVFVGGRPKFRACDLDEYVRSQVKGADVKVGSRNRSARDEHDRVAAVGSDVPRVPERRDPSRRAPATPQVVRRKGLNRKPNEVDRYAARTYGLDLRAMKVSGPLLQEILHIDANQYKSWAYEGGELPAPAKEKFDSWCAGYVQSIRKMYPDGSDLLIDPASPLV